MERDGQLRLPGYVRVSIHFSASSSRHMKPRAAADLMLSGSGVGSQHGGVQIVWRGWPSGFGDRCEQWPWFDDRKSEH